MGQTTRTAPRPAARRPVPTPPSDSSRPAPPASFERVSAVVRQSGFQVLPPPPVKGLLKTSHYSCKLV